MKKNLCDPDYIDMFDEEELEKYAYNFTEGILHKENKKRGRKKGKYKILITLGEYPYFRGKAHYLIVKQWLYGMDKAGMNKKQ